MKNFFPILSLTTLLIVYAQPGIASVYKCTGENGAVSYQAIPCSKTSSQAEQRVIRAPSQSQGQHQSSQQRFENMKNYLEGMESERHEKERKREMLAEQKRTEKAEAKRKTNLAKCLSRKARRELQADFIQRTTPYVPPRRQPRGYKNRVPPDVHGEQYMK